MTTKMKKLIYLFLSIFMIAAVVSCSKEATSDNGLDLLKKATVITTPTASSPVSLGVGVTPYLIPGANNGGNRTCAEVATAFNTSFDLCGDKLDYDDYDFDGDMEFSGSFPDGLNVTVTNGTFVAFDMTDCIMIGDKYYKVGAVIVKGSDQANVYYYEGGVLSDYGLASPVNASGSPSGLSNLTFCFVECEPQTTEVLIAVKSWYWGSYVDGVGSNYNYTVSVGTNVYTANDWCDVLGINYFPTTTDFDLSENVGTVHVEVGYPGGVRSLIITVDLNDGMMLTDTYVYVGTLAGLGSLTTCPEYWNWPNSDLTTANTKTFTIPY
jgi:hypothetical protein